VNINLKLTSNEIDYEIHHKEKYISKKNASSIWFRRSKLKPIKSLNETCKLAYSKKIISKLNFSLKKEQEILFSFLNKQLHKDSKLSIGNPSVFSLNKLDVLA